MIFIRVQFLNEFNTTITAVIEVSRSTTIGELANRGFFNVAIV